MGEFIEYLDKCLSKIDNEKKEVFISWDFNIDLLKLGALPKYQDSYNTITSYGFLPQIINPRIKVNSATIIDNIFSNIVNHNQTRGNILIELSDHLPQFLSVNRNKPDLSNIKMYTRNYSKFSNESFCDDVSIQKWDNNLEDVNDQFNDFLARLEGCVDWHAPIKELNQREKKLIKLIKKRNCIFKNKKKEGRC